MSDPLMEFYADGLEANRLTRGIGPLEAVRTTEILDRCLPEVAGIVYDVGGGPGYYSRYLAGRGYSVHLIDSVPEHVRAAAEGDPPIASAVIGDARDLPWEAESADVVLLMGPLYHLREETDRITALNEACRVLRPDGLLFVTIIPRWASALIGMLRGWVFDSAYADMIHKELTSGFHERPGNWPALFMDGYFHSLGDLTREMARAGLEIEEALAIEGPAWMCADFPDAWQDLERREEILTIARLSERDPNLLGASPHVAVVGRKDRNAA